MLAVDCGSAPPTAWRALSAAICSGVACFAAGASPQNPRALMMSAGVSGFASVFAAGAGTGFAGFASGTIGTSADASWIVAAAGLARGSGEGSAGLAGIAAAIRLGAD